MNTNFQDDFDAFLDSCADDHIAVKPASPARKQYPCGQCAGTGRYQGARVHQAKSHCFACKGKGYFLSSHEDRKQAAAKRAQSKKATLEAKRAAFDEQHPGVADELFSAVRAGSTNDFINSLAGAIHQYGSLTDNQVNAYYRGKAKLEQMKAERAAREAAAPEVDLTPIRTMFETAVENGYKKPTYRAEGLVISRAPDTGSNPGALYVKTDEQEYLGKVVGVKLHALRTAPDSLHTALAAIAADPLGAALRYGQRTGRCACCGRELTNHASIDLGIGPICKQKWGL
jgi:hypothetical protein